VDSYNSAVLFNSLAFQKIFERRIIGCKVSVRSVKRLTQQSNKNYAALSIGVYTYEERIKQTPVKMPFKIAGNAFKTYFCINLFMIW